MKKGKSDNEIMVEEMKTLVEVYAKKEREKNKDINNSIALLRSILDSPSPSTEDINFAIQLMLILITKVKSAEDLEESRLLNVIYILLPFDKEIKEENFSGLLNAYDKLIVGPYYRPILQYFFKYFVPIVELSHKMKYESKSQEEKNKYFKDQIAYSNQFCTGLLAVVEMYSSPLLDLYQYLYNFKKSPCLAYEKLALLSYSNEQFIQEISEDYSKFLEEAQIKHSVSVKEILVIPTDPKAIEEFINKFERFYKAITHKSGKKNYDYIRLQMLFIKEKQMEIEEKIRSHQVIDNSNLTESTMNQKNEIEEKDDDSASDLTIETPLSSEIKKSDTSLSAINEKQKSNEEPLGSTSLILTDDLQSNSKTLIEIKNIKANMKDLKEEMNMINQINTQKEGIVPEQAEEKIQPNEEEKKKQDSKQVGNLLSEQGQPKIPKDNEEMKHQIGTVSQSNAKVMKDIEQFFQNSLTVMEKLQHDFSKIIEDNATLRVENGKLLQEIKEIKKDNVNRDRTIAKLKKKVQKISEMEEEIKGLHKITHRLDKKLKQKDEAVSQFQSNFRLLRGRQVGKTFLFALKEYYQIEFFMGYTNLITELKKKQLNNQSKPIQMNHVKFCYLCDFFHSLIMKGNSVAHLEPEIIYEINRSMKSKTIANEIHSFITQFQLFDSSIILPELYRDEIVALFNHFTTLTGTSIQAFIHQYNDFQ